MAIENLQQHTEDCLDVVGMDEYQPTAAAPAAASRAVTGPSRAAFRPAGASGPALRPATRSAAASGTGGRGPGNELAAVLFPPSPQRAGTATASYSRQPLATVQASLGARARADPKPDKGKGRAVAQEWDGYLSSDDVPNAHVPVRRGGNMLDLRDSDDNDVIVQAGSTSFGAGGGGGGWAGRTGARAGRSDGREGSVNAAYAPGPPADGSSPPSGSIYISTLPHAFREGCESLARPRFLARRADSRSTLSVKNLYAVAEPKAKRARPANGSNGGYGGPSGGGGGGAGFGGDYDDYDDDDAEARAMDAMAPKKAASGGRQRGGGRGGRGKGVSRRGNSWSWRGKAARTRGGRKS